MHRVMVLYHMKPPRGFWRKLIFHPIPALTAQCVTKEARQDKLSINIALLRYHFPLNQKVVQKTESFTLSRKG